MPDSATPWTAAHQDPLSMGFSRQGYYRVVCPLLLQKYMETVLFLQLLGKFEIILKQNY